MTGRNRAPRRLPIADLILSQRLLRWPNVTPAMVERLGFAGSVWHITPSFSVIHVTNLEAQIIITGHVSWHRGGSMIKRPCLRYQYHPLYS